MDTQKTLAQRIREELGDRIDMRLAESSDEKSLAESLVFTTTQPLVRAELDPIIVSHYENEYRVEKNENSDLLFFRGEGTSGLIVNVTIIHANMVQSSDRQLMGARGLGTIEDGQGLVLLDVLIP